MPSPSSWLLPGEDKGEGDRHQHFHAKERLPAGGGEPVRPAAAAAAAALHVLLHPAGLQPPAAVPPVQPHHAAGLVGHTQLHRPRAGTSPRLPLSASFTQQPPLYSSWSRDRWRSHLGYVEAEEVVFSWPCVFLKWCLDKCIVTFHNSVELFQSTMQVDVAQSGKGVVLQPQGRRFDPRSPH